MSNQTQMVACLAAGAVCVSAQAQCEPEQVTFAPMPSTLGALHLQNGHLYVGIGGSARIYDAAHFPVLTQIGAFNTPGSVYGVDRTGDLAYVADEYAGLTVVDLTDIDAPFVLGTLDLEYRANAVDAQEHLAIVATGTGDNGQLDVVDATMPWAPNLLGSAASPSPLVDVCVADGYAYAVEYRYQIQNGGLRVFDVRDPHHPELVGGVSIGDGGHDVDVADGFAYVAARHDGLLIVDIQDPTQPTIVGSLKTSTDARCVVLDLPTVYVGTGYPGELIAVDVCDPTAPQQIGTASAYFVAMAAQMLRPHVVTAAGNFVDVLEVYNVSSCAATNCPADLDCDGQLTVLDFVVFQSLWTVNDARADCDENATFNILDFVCFNQLFTQGCD